MLWTTILSSPVSTDAFEAVRWQSSLLVATTAVLSLDMALISPNSLVESADWSRDFSEGSAVRSRECTAESAVRPSDSTTGSADWSRDFTAGLANLSRDFTAGSADWSRDTSSFSSLWLS